MWQRISFEIATKTLPRETVPLTPTIQPLEQQLAYALLKLGENTTIVRHGKVVEVPSHFEGDRPPQVREFEAIAVLSEPLVDGRKGSPQPLLRGFALQPHFASSTPSPVVGKSKVVEGGRTLTSP
jgi:hypothetical protein